MACARWSALIGALLLGGAPGFIASASASPSEAPALPAPPLHVWTVDRGTRGVLVEDHREPLVELRIQFPAGRWSPWVRKKHYAPDAFELQLYDPAGALRSRVDRLGMDVSLGTGPRATTLSLGCRKEMLDSALALARAILTNRDFDPREIKRRNHERDLEWQAERKNPSHRLMATAYELLFAPDDPRLEPFERPRRVPANAKLLSSARDTLVRLPGRLIGVAGDLTPAEAERLAGGLLPPALETAPAPAEPTLAAPAPAGKRRGERVVRLPRLTQVYMALVRDNPKVTDPDYPAYLVADHVLAGYFYSRLYVALRHEGGNTYSVDTYGSAETAAGVYGPWTYTNTANAHATEAKLREAMRVFREDGITDEERADAVGWLRGRRAFSRQSPAQILERVLWEMSRGLPPGYRDANADRAARLSLAEINRFIRDFYDPTLYTKVEVEPK